MKTVNMLKQDLVAEGPMELSFPKPSQDDVGWLLVGGGVVGSVVNLVRRERRAIDWLIPLGLFGIGCGVLLRSRQSRMNSAEEGILAELDNLDPIARAQVLKAVAQEQIDRLPGFGSDE